jgi:uncharacterized protein (DUF1330 family)
MFIRDPFRAASQQCFVLIEFDDLDKANKLMNSDGLKEAMKKAGVVGKPDIYLMDEGIRTKV